MYSNIIRAIPFCRISQVFTPGITTLPYPILRDISETYINTIPPSKNTTENKTNQIIVKNTKPLVTSYLSFRELFEKSKSITDFETLHKEVDSILVQGYFRDIATYSIPEKQMVIIRVWFNYNRETRLIKFVNVYELCNDYAWCIDTQQYFNMIQQPETILTPSFDEISGGNDRFVKKLQVMV
jgi:hypothetical protein